MATNFVEQAVEIRLAIPGDAAGILALNERVAGDSAYFLAYETDPGSGADMLRAKLGAGGGDSGCVLVACVNGGIVGVLLARAHQHPSFVGVVQIGLCIDSEWRRAGIGRGLVDAAIAWARVGGHRRLQLAVVDGNKGALALFENAGFVQEGALRAAAMIDGKRHDVLPMGLLLD